MINFAIVVEKEVVYNLIFDTTNNMGEKWIAILRSNPKMVKVSGYAFLPGDFLIDSEVYRKNSSNELEKLDKNESINDHSVHFVAIFDNEIAGAMSLAKGIIDQSVIDRVEKAFTLDYKIIEAPLDVSFGWSYDGTTFSKLKE
jgi:hypothetical protein